MGFRDHFSTQAASYAKYRPRYPSQLTQYLAELAPTRERAWDCATGNGQVAVALAEEVRGVVATDASERQIAHAESHPRVTYRVAPAEASGLEPRSVDLVTVAQALHWFDLPGFYAEVRRVVRPGGVLAVWCYGLFEIAPEVDPLLDEFYRVTVGPYWPPERRHVEAGYATLEFPFDELPAPAFAMELEWDLEALLGYLGTWSAVERYRRAEGRDPIADLAPRLAEPWGPPPKTRRARWPLKIKLAKPT